MTTAGTCLKIRTMHVSMMCAITSESIHTQQQLVLQHQLVQFGCAGVLYVMHADTSMSAVPWIMRCVALQQATLFSPYMIVTSALPKHLFNHMPLYWHTNMFAMA